jgi:hypothetical protein
MKYLNVCITCGCKEFKCYMDNNMIFIIFLNNTFTYY